MSTQTTEYILSQDGTVRRRSIVDAEIDVAHHIIESFSKNIVHKIPAIMGWQDMGVLGLAVTPGAQYWTLSFNRLTIRCPWRLVGEAMVPAFNSATDPMMTMVWTPPEQCYLKLVIRSMPFAHSTKVVTMNGVWFMAADQAGRTWRLPIPNVHDDCSVCTGARESYHATALQGLEQVITTFTNSAYNADLWKNAEITQSFFRMKPVGKSFETIPVAGDWTKFCIKVNNSVSTYIA